MWRPAPPNRPTKLGTPGNLDHPTGPAGKAGGPNSSAADDATRRDNDSAEKNDQPGKNAKEQQTASDDPADGGFDSQPEQSRRRPQLSYTPGTLALTSACRSTCGRRRSADVTPARGAQLVGRGPSEYTAHGERRQRRGRAPQGNDPDRNIGELFAA
jgi:hypothetical protein